MIRTEDLIKQAYVQLLLREGDGERRRKGEEGCRKKWEKKMRERKWILPFCVPRSRVFLLCVLIHSHSSFR